MTGLPIVSGDQCVKALERLGYRVSRTKGSHMWLVGEGRAPVPVPRHRELDRGTLKNILKVVDITVDEFISLLR